MALFTLLLVLIGAWQGRQNRKAANAARDANNLARRAFQRGQRPYVFVFDVYELMAGNPQEQPFVSYTVANHGRTPAIIEDLRAELVITTEPEPPISAMQVERAHPLLQSPILSPDERRTRVRIEAPAGMSFTPDMVHVIPRLNTQEDLFLFIIVYYRGPFTKGHVSTFCWRYDHASDGFIAFGGQKYNHLDQDEDDAI